jgi:hypothetical protein
VVQRSASSSRATSDLFGNSSADGRSSGVNSDNSSRGGVSDNNSSSGSKGTSDTSSQATAAQKLIMADVIETHADVHNKVPDDKEVTDDKEEEDEHKEEGDGEDTEKEEEEKFKVPGKDKGNLYCKNEGHGTETPRTFLTKEAKLGHMARAHKCSYSSRGCPFYYEMEAELGKHLLNCHPVANLENACIICQASVEKEYLQRHNEVMHNQWAKIIFVGKLLTPNWGPDL